MTPEIMYGIGTVVLLAALAWGIHQTRTRDPARAAMTDHATRDVYQHPGTYDREAELRGTAPDNSTRGAHDPNTTEARQGETSNHMRWVLLASCVLAVVVLGAATYFTH